MVKVTEKRTYESPKWRILPFDMSIMQQVSLPVYPGDPGGDESTARSYRGWFDEDDWDLDNN